MKIKFKRVMAMVVAMVCLLTSIPTNSVWAVSDGDTKQASIEGIGKLGTVKIGSKTESGSWVKTLVGNDDVFCLDLGKACHTGYVYKAKNTTISSDSSNKKNALEAKIGYWYAVDKKYSNKAWLYAQCLIWAVEEGVTSESGLKDIIKQVKDNTGYYSNDSLYSDIFGRDATVTCKIIKWSYNGATDEDEVQELMQIVGDKIEFDYKYISDSEYYRQRITLQKDDEDGKPLPQVTFRFTAKNVKELYSYQYNGWGDPVEDDVDNGVSKFTQDVKTDSNGKITFRFTYKLHSKRYYYVPADQLDDMSSADKKKMREDLDDQGYKYPDDLKKSSAEKMIQDDIDDQMDDISNQYVIEEIASNNANLLTSFVVDQGADKVKIDAANKVTVTLKKADSWTKNSDDKWPETAEESYSNYKLAYKPVLKDKYKKVKLEITKKDAETNSTTPQGDATLIGAVYGVYSDATCTKLLDSYKTGSDCTFETKYYRCGQTYYIKEITPPTGYLKNNQVYALNEDGQKYTVEYNIDKSQVTETPIKGDVSIIKGMGNGDAGIVPFEKNAQFQIYLASAGSYDKAKTTERDVLVTDLLGYAKSKKLPYGTYVVHQTVAADNTEKCPDFYVNITENDKTYPYLLNNPEFTAYIKVVKKDSRTHQTVLKSGTTYQIYCVDKDGKETIVTQARNNGNKIDVVDRFVSDDTGEIITYQKLKSGTYKVYEIEGPEGYKVNTKPVTVEINDKSYKTMKDALGNTYYYAECEYFNGETYGQFTINKDGTALYKEADIQVASEDAEVETEAKVVEVETETDETEDTTAEETVNPFTYKNVALKKVVFELVAKEDIMSQDNQGTVVFAKDSVVANITTGEGVKFTNTVDGICKSKMNADGTITLNVPLGEYTLKEVKTAYGYILPEQSAWDLSFKWNNSKDEYVLDVSENTVDGTVFIHNELVGTEINLEKKDSKTEKPIPNAVFGFYSKDNIYDVNGNIVVAADEKICDVTTDAEGKAKIPFNVPLMDEGYGEIEGKLNSGDYFFLEESVSDSYFVSEEPHFVHLEYKDQETATVTAEVTVLEEQTEVVVDKMMIGSSEEVKDCYLKISDTDGNEIISWITGDKDSVKVNENLADMGYCNVYVDFDDVQDENSDVQDEKDNVCAIKIHGLLHDKEYILTETKLADGYVTAIDISFMIKQKVEAAEFTQEVLIKNGEEFVGTDSNRVVMYDDTTKVELTKYMIASSVELPGCELEVTDKETGDVIDAWTSTNEAHLIEKVFVVGKTYVLTEKRPADGYVTADQVEFTIADTGEVQSVKMYDDTTKMEFSKLSITDGQELPGCKMKVTDKETGKVMDEWTSTEFSHVIEGKYVVGKTYILSETKPADGYATATDVEFTVLDDGKVQKVSMVDDTTKVEFSKLASDTKKQLKGAKYKVYNSKGKKIYEFTTGKKAEMIEGVFKVGETYTFKEVDAPEHYKLAKDKTITIRDTGNVQKLTAVDIRIPEVPDTPQTGFMNDTTRTIISLLSLLLAVICVVCVRAKDKSKYSFKPEGKENEEE